jgi:hypothetical protein
VHSGEGVSQNDERARLERAEQAYAVGDYRALLPLVRSLAGSSTPEIAARARALLRAIRPDPVQVLVLALCALAFLVICWHYLRS